MEQRDLIKDEIEKIGKMLLGIFSRVLGKSFEGDISIRLEVATQQLQEELDIDITKLVALEGSELKNHLEKRKINDSTHFEKLVEYLEIVAKNKKAIDKESAEGYLICALDLLDLADSLSQKMTMKRMKKKAEIEKLLSEL